MTCACTSTPRVSPATAGMGWVDYGPSLEDLGITGDEQRQFGVDPTQSPGSSGVTFGEGLDYASDILGGVMGAIGAGVGIASRYQYGQMQRRQASTMFEQQMETFAMRREEARATGQMDRYMELLTLQNRLENANTAAASGDDPAAMAALMAVLQESESATSAISPTMWAIGGVGAAAVLGLGGLLIWALTKDKD